MPTLQVSWNNPARIYLDSTTGQQTLTSAWNTATNLYAARLVGWPLGYLVWGGFSKSFKADMTCENLERCFQNSRRKSRIDT